MNNLISEAKNIPIDQPIQTISISPVTLSVPERPLPLELRITMPASGDHLPIILLSHGHGPSLYIPSKDGYGPLVNFYAEHGFAVIQPTHLNAKVAGLPANAPGGPLFWEQRAKDMTAIVDRLGDIEAAVPMIAGRLDHGRIAAVGHSLGGQTVGMLLGALLTDTKDPAVTKVSTIEPRIKAGVLLAAPGNGGDSLSSFAAETYSCMNPDYGSMTTPNLVVTGDDDANPHLTVRGPDWHADPFHHSPGSDALLTLFGGKHGMGGIAGYDAKETGDEDPDRLAIVQRLTWAYLRSALYTGDRAWQVAREALETHASKHGRIDVKRGIQAA